MFSGTKINEDGTVEIMIAPEGLPAGECLVPTPFMSEEERDAEIRAAIDELFWRGLIIESRSRIRNPAFDKPGQKTTTKFTFRPCKTEAEARLVLARIKEIGDRLLKGQKNEAIIGYEASTYL